MKLHLKGVAEDILMPGILLQCTLMGLMESMPCQLMAAKSKPIRHNIMPHYNSQTVVFYYFEVGETPPVFQL